MGHNLPILDAIIKDTDTRALYLFPTKALAQDQLAELYATIEALGEDIATFTYDGDTPQDARKAIRSKAHIVVTNPDMLHKGILPHHTKWVKLFENLKYVVIDELHMNRGVYGSHVGNALRRLRRLCRFYGSDPQFLCCSATIRNPAELATALTGKPVEWIQESRAPRSDRYLAIDNTSGGESAVGDPEVGTWFGARYRFAFPEKGLLTIVFAPSRLATEVLVTWPEARLSPPQGEGFALPQGHVREQAWVGGCAPRVSRGACAAEASRDRAGAARGVGAGCGVYQRSRARDRHRVARYRGDAVVSGDGRVPQGQASRSIWQQAEWSGRRGSTSAAAGRGSSVRRGQRYFAISNPPVVNRQLGIRKSAVGSERDIAPRSHSRLGGPGGRRGFSGRGYRPSSSRPRVWLPRRRARPPRGGFALSQGHVREPGLRRLEKKSGLSATPPRNLITAVVPERLWVYANSQGPHGAGPHAHRNSVRGDRNRILGRNGRKTGSSRT